MDHQSGFVVDRGDLRAMADKILKLINDSELREQMGHLGLRWWPRASTLRINVEKLINLSGIKNGNKNRAAPESRSLII